MAQELPLNAIKLARLVKHIAGGGEATTAAAESVLRMKKPEFVAAYLAEAKEQAALTPPASDPDPTPDDLPAPAPEATSTPTQEADPVPAPATTPPATPATTPPAATAPKLARFINKDGQTIKLVVKSETDKAIIYEEDVPKEMVTIILKGSPAQVNALDPNLAPDIRQAVELARA